MRSFFLLLCVCKLLSAAEHHKVIIIGAGSAGIAAATRLLENGIDDLEILEAEERIGGRIHSVQLGDTLVDVGAQHVRAEKGNAVYDIAQPLNLLSNRKFDPSSLTRLNSSNVSLKDGDDDRTKTTSSMNWKNKSFSTVLEILMKRYPNPDEELPVMNKTKLNKKVSKINYSTAGPISLKTIDDSDYTADYVIFTPSAGVLKAHHRSLFEPNLSEEKIRLLDNLKVTQSAKIYLHYDNPWWSTTDDISKRAIIWTNFDAEALANDIQRSWLLSVKAVEKVPWRPKVLLVLLSGSNIDKMELLPESFVRAQIIWMINKFFKSQYNTTEPTILARSTWCTNDNFLGSSARPVDSSKFSMSSSIGEPVMQGNVPKLLFAGDATGKRFGGVNEAIKSGWREAERLIKFEKSVEKRR